MITTRPACCRASSPIPSCRCCCSWKDQAEVVIVISAEDIISNKIRGDYGITYDLDVLRLIDAFQEDGPVCGQRVRDQVHRRPGGGGL